MTRPAPACPVCEVHAESVFRVEGMDCHDEVAILERRLKPLRGLEAIRADLVAGTLRVSHDAAQLSAAAIAEAVNATGMRAWLDHDVASSVTVRANGVREAFLVGSGVAVAAGAAMEWFDVPRAVTVVWFAVSIAAGGWYWARRAWSAARLFALDINALMLIAVVGAIAIGQWSEAAMVTFLFALAQWMESHSMERARLAIRALMELSPHEALVSRDGRDVRVPVDAVAIDDTLVVRPGEKIPLDGVVSAGESEVNQAPITGESRLVPKAPGADVYAGTINGHGALSVRVTRLRGDSTLARITNLVEHAQSERAPSQTFVERFARIYTPAVVALAAAVAVAPPLAGVGDRTEWFYRALVFLVISCPCALVLSTPVSVVSAIAGAARKGVLIKGGRHLETLGRVLCIAFDKTGTLTHGTPAVAAVAAVPPWTRRDVLRIAASIESRSEHPIGRAIRRAAREETVETPPCGVSRALPGLGVSADVDGVPAVIGSRRLFEERGWFSAALLAADAGVAGPDRTTVFVASGNQPVGVIAVADAIRQNGREAIRLLRLAGVPHIAMLTGDDAAAAGRVGAAMEISDVRASLLPKDKLAAVRDLKAAHRVVAMVGDGVNDAPALAGADVGIAMGAAGSDVALETADVALMSDELLRIPYAVRLSRSTVRTIQLNIGFSLGLKAVFLALAGLGIATLWMAVVADMGASLLVIANGLRLLRFN